MKTIKDLLKTGTNRYNRIRQLARRQCELDNRLIKCEKCGWNKHVEVGHIKPIPSFSLDTEVSIVNDVTNLTVLCPNCHWLHDHRESENRKICECGSKKHRSSNLCRKCSNKKMVHFRKVNRPSKEELEKLIEEFSMLQLGKRFGVSDVAVKKWCVKYGIVLGNRLGHWQKKRCKSLVSSS